LQHVVGVGRLQVIRGAAARRADEGHTGGQAIIVLRPVVVDRTCFKPGKSAGSKRLREPRRRIFVAYHIDAVAHHRYWDRDADVQRDEPWTTQPLEDGLLSGAVKTGPPNVPAPKIGPVDPAASKIQGRSRRLIEPTD